MNEFAPNTEKYRIHYVRITNHLDVPFTDRYDGVPFTLEPGAVEHLPLETAAHFFGYTDGVSHDVMFRHTAKRQGWNTPEHIKRTATGKTLAEDLFSHLSIEAVTYRMVEDKPNLEQPIPADPDPTPDELPATPPRRGRAGAV